MHVKPIADCGKRYRDESANWYIQYKDANDNWKRVAGYKDKEATRQKAADLERRVERMMAGLSDPFEDASRRRLKDHLTEFKEYLANKGVSEKHANQTHNRIERCFLGSKFKLWLDISASQLVAWLAEERNAGRMGFKTSNYYQSAAKEFCTWMVKDQRVAHSPLNHLSALNTDGDIRRNRRSVSEEEFTWLVKAASNGPVIQFMTGMQRAMLYVLATWTGYRRKELASLTLGSFDLDSESPSVQVTAAYSKRKRNDSIPLHSVVIEHFKQWINEYPIPNGNKPIFPLKSKGGHLRRTSKMMKLDLESARTSWIEEANDVAERTKREQSNFLKYCDDDGLFADFHANRHTFISNLGKAGISPKLAQTLARHSDPKLTMNIYTHVDSADQAEAISRLAAPPVFSTAGAAESGLSTLEHRNEDRKAVAQGVAQEIDFACQTMSSDGNLGTLPASDQPKKKPSGSYESQGFFNDLQRLSSDDASSGGGIRTPDTRIMIPLL